MSQALEIGFLVEGDIDKEVIEAIALRMLSALLGSEDFVYNAVRMGGKTALPWASATVLAMLKEDGYHHVIVVVDADTTQRGRAQHRRRKVEAMLAEDQLEKNEVSVCVAVPTIEAWLLAGYEERPEEVEDPKKKLRQHLGIQVLTPKQAAAEAEKLDLDLARKRAPSFDQFAKTLTEVVDRLQKNASAA